MSSSGEWLAGSFIIYFWNDSENRKFRLGVDASDFRCGWPTRQVAQARILTGVSGATRVGPEVPPPGSMPGDRWVLPELEHCVIHRGLVR